MECLEERRVASESSAEEEDATEKSDRPKNPTTRSVVQAIDLNVRLHDSKISNEEIYKQLELVDRQSAQKIHPNDRRKLCRF